jgi:hypothetical protein
MGESPRPQGTGRPLLHRLPALSVFSESRPVPFGSLNSPLNKAATRCTSDRYGTLLMPYRITASLTRC